MEDKQRRHLGPRLRWTLGSLIIVVVLSAVAIALARPFVAQAPPSGEVIGISFDFQATRSADGRPIMSLAPRVTTTKRAAPTAKS